MLIFSAAFPASIFAPGEKNSHPHSFFVHGFCASWYPLGGYLFLDLFSGHNHILHIEPTKLVAYQATFRLPFSINQIYAKHIPFGLWRNDRQTQFREARDFTLAKSRRIFYNKKTAYRRTNFRLLTIKKKIAYRRNTCGKRNDHRIGLRRPV